MTVSTRSEKKPIVHQTIRLRIEKFEALLDSGESSTHWSEGVSSELVPQAIWKLKVMVYPTGNAEKRRGSISVELCRTGPMVRDERDLYASFYLYLIGRLGIRMDAEKRGSCNFRKVGDRWGWDISHAQVKRALQADGSLLVAAHVQIDPHYHDDGGEGVEEAIYEAWYLRGDKIQRQPSVNSPSVSPTDMAPSDPSTEAWAPSGDETQRQPSVNSPYASYSGKDPSDSSTDTWDPIDDETRWRASVYSPSVSYSDKTSSELSIEFERRSIWLARSIDKVLNSGNVVAMAVLIDTYSAKKLREACTELIAREGNTVFESADWKELEGIKPKLAVDLAFGAAAFTNTNSSEKIKEICIGLITSRWRTVYETAVWRVLRETKPQFALDLAEEATRVLAEKK